MVNNPFPNKFKFSIGGGIRMWLWKIKKVWLDENEWENVPIETTIENLCQLFNNRYFDGLVYPLLYERKIKTILKRIYRLVLFRGVYMDDVSRRIWNRKVSLSFL